MGQLLTVFRRRSGYARRVLATQRSQLVAYWPLDELAGTVAANREGTSARNGTHKGAGEPLVGQVAAPFTAPLWDGTNDYTNIQTASLAAFSATAGTLACWLRVVPAAWTDAMVRRALILQADSGNRIIVEKTSTSDQLALYYVAGAVTKSITKCRASLAASGWVHLALTWDKPGDAVKAYFNGVQEGSTQTALGVWAGSLGVSVIGAASLVPGQPWSGNLAHVGIWRTALTAGEIAPLATITRNKNIVFEGDSLTFGSGATYSYPQQLMRKVTATCAGTNVATSGHTIDTMTAEGAAVDALRSSGHRQNVLCFYGGTNNLAGAETATTVYNKIVAYCQARRAAGWRVIVCTMLPASATGYAADYYAKRNAVNASIRASWSTFADGVADIGANATIGPDGAELNTTYYAADRVHMVDAGYAIMADIVLAAVNTL
jgi:lysophospholipase L1-like esterase